MKIIIASSNRSHLLDVAREMHNLKNEVTFISFTPRWRLKKYNIQQNITISVFWFCLPGIILTKLFPSDLTREILRILLDYSTCFHLKKCDFFICQSPHFQRSMKIARKKYKAKILLDRGSNHVRYYNQQLLKANVRTMREWYLKFDESQYKYADYILLASSYCKKTFIEYGVPEKKLFSNPYGVNTTNFYPTELAPQHYDIIYVGNLSKNKGSDLLIQACSDLNLSLLHVGATVDIQFPFQENFKHINPVPEKELIKYYKQAKVFCMPSHNEGFGLVLIQAAACGLPIVTTEFTGGPDLKEMLKDQSYIYNIKQCDIHLLKKALLNALNISSTQKGMRNYASNIQTLFSWKSYALRLNQFLLQIKNNTI